MLIGVNLASPHSLPVVRALLRQGEAEFCEILVDNFLHLDPESLRIEIGSVPTAFHVMWSRFIERDSADLRALAMQLRRFMDVFRPLYVSDHLARFTHAGRRLALLAEVRYRDDYASICSRVHLWQEFLGSQLLLENFPSVLGQDANQPVFFSNA